MPCHYRLWVANIGHFGVAKREGLRDEKPLKEFVT
jgi:hypothetical protein